MTANDLVLGRVDRLTLRDRAIDALRQAILDGDIVPGTRLTEVKLSQELGLSRGTVREAVLRLAQEHLVVITARHGISVRVLSAQELLDIYAVRAELEGMSARLAAACPRPETEALLTDRIARMVESMSKPFLQQVAADLAFHEAICELSANSWLLAMWRLLSGPIRGALVSAGPDLVRPQRALPHHRAVSNAIIAGDAVEAPSVLVRHLLASAEELAAGMQTRQGDKTYARRIATWEG